MSNKNPQWPGANGKPGVSFGPKGGQKTGAGKDSGSATSTVIKPGANNQQNQPTGKVPAQAKPQAQPQAKQESAKQGGKPATETASPKGQGRQPAAAPLWTAPPSPATMTPKPADSPTAAPGGKAASKSVQLEKSNEKSSTDTTGRSSSVTRRTRRARLRLTRVDPWSVMKTSFLFSIAFGIILVVVTWVLWGVLVASGALDSVNSTMNQLIGDSNSQFEIRNFIDGGRVVGLAALLAAIDVVILTAVSTLFAFLYNLAATVLGGLEVTLAED